MSPETIIAIGTAVAAISGSLSWIVGAKIKEKKLYKENGFERRENTITRSEHDQCRTNRESQEKTLFKNLDKIEACVNQNRIELRDDIKRQGEDSQRRNEKIFEKLDELTKRSYSQGGKG